MMFFNYFGDLWNNYSLGIITAFIVFLFITFIPLLIKENILYCMDDINDNVSSPESDSGHSKVKFFDANSILEKENLINLLVVQFFSSLYLYFKRMYRYNITFKVPLFL